MTDFDEARNEKRSTLLILVVVALVALMLTGPAVLARAGTASAARAFAGLPTGTTVLGSVYDGIKVPYSLDLRGASSARVILTVDGVVFSDVSGAPASGTITVPGGSPLLHLDNGAVLSIVAKAPDGSVLDSASGSGVISNGVVLPQKLPMYTNNPSVQLSPGDTKAVDPGETVRFQTSIQTGGSNIYFDQFNLTVDGSTILETPKDCSVNPCGGSQYLNATWVAPTTAGNHTLVLSGSAVGDSRTIRQTYTLSVQPQGTWHWDTRPTQVDATAGWGMSATLQRADNYAPVPNAPLEVWWLSDAMGSTAVKLMDGTTDGSGQFSYRFHPTASGWFELRTAGVPGVIGTVRSGYVHVEVTAKVTLSPSRATVSLPTYRTWSTARGVNQRTIDFSVTAPVGMAGNSALLQLWSGTTWNTVAWGKLAADGTIHLRYVVPRVRGDYKFGILTGRNANYAPTTSADVHVLVR